MAASGYPISIILSPSVPADLKCLLCNLVMRDACKSCCSEDHAFCFDCLAVYFEEYGKRCPSCNEDLQKKSPVPFRVLRETIAKLHVRCLKSSRGSLNRKRVFSCSETFLGDGCREGCSWKGRLGDLDSHVRDECELTDHSIVLCGSLDSNVKFYPKPFICQGSRFSTN